MISGVERKLSFITAGPYLNPVFYVIKVMYRNNLKQTKHIKVNTLNFMAI